MKNTKMKTKSNNIMKTAYIFFALFLLLMVYFTSFLLFTAKDVVNNPYNKRQEAFAEKVVRGKIYSNSYELLAQTVVDESGNETRVYPFDNLFAQTVGYNSNGKLGLELQYNYNLLSSDANGFEKIINEFKAEKNIGNNIITTLDVDAQKSASDALGNNSGAVIVLEPETGKILAMVSKPDFNPNQINEIYDELIANEEETSLNNRATMGLYTPGSTFKIFTLLEFIRENKDTYENYTYQCTGSITTDGITVSCFNNTVHGNENLLSSFANSCNSSFINLGLTLDKTNFASNCNKLLFNSELPLDFSYRKSEFNLDANTTNFMTAQTVMGQGETRVTPIHMAMMISAIANQGVLMQPYMVEYIENYQGTVIEKIQPQKYGKLIKSSEAEILKNYMREVVINGTASELNSNLYTAYGKTGTAQIDSGGKENSWFVGFAEKDGKKIAVAIVFEEVNPGQKYGVNAAKQIFDEYFNS